MRDRKTVLFDKTFLRNSVKCTHLPCKVIPQGHVTQRARLQLAKRISQRESERVSGGQKFPSRAVASGGDPLPRAPVNPATSSGEPCRTRTRTRLSRSPASGSSVAAARSAPASAERLHACARMRVPRWLTVVSLVQPDGRRELAPRDFQRLWVCEFVQDPVGSDGCRRLCWLRRLL